MGACEGTWYRWGCQLTLRLELPMCGGEANGSAGDYGTLMIHPGCVMALVLDFVSTLSIPKTAARSHARLGICWAYLYACSILTI